MYQNIRQLIDAAWRRAGVRGDGDPIDNGDAAYGLGLLNSILDTLSTDMAFKAGTIKRTVTAKADGSIVIANDPARVISLVASTAPNAVITVSGIHGLTLGASIVLAGTSLIDGTYTVSSINSASQFTVTGVAVSGTARGGAWKLASESNDYLIDLAITPPGQLVAVNDGALSLCQYPEDVYYEALASGTFTQGWFYEPAFDPYPILRVSGAGAVDIVMNQPGFTDVTLNTVISSWPKGMAEVVLWDLTSLLATGYPNVIQMAIERRDAAKGLFKRQRRKLMSEVSDGSAPGRGARTYDFYSDSYRG